MVCPCLTAADAAADGDDDDYYYCDDCCCLDRDERATCDCILMMISGSLAFADGYYCTYLCCLDLRLEETRQILATRFSCWALS